MRRYLIGLALAFVACGGDSTTAPAVTVTGTWTLQTINGAPLPFVVLQSGTDKLELVSDVLVFSGSGSFTQTSTLRSTTNGTATTQSASDAGTYTVTGTAVNIRFNSDGSTGTGSLSGNTLTATDGGLALVYKR